jgi:hypothetical protein
MAVVMAVVARQLYPLPGNRFFGSVVFCLYPWLFGYFGYLFFLSFPPPCVLFAPFLLAHSHSCFCQVSRLQQLGSLGRWMEHSTFTFCFGLILVSSAGLDWIGLTRWLIDLGCWQWAGFVLECGSLGGCVSHCFFIFTYPLFVGY